MLPWLIILSLYSVASMSTMKEYKDLLDDAHLDDSSCPVHGVHVDGFGGAFNDAAGDKSNCPEGERIFALLSVSSLCFSVLSSSAYCRLAVAFAFRMNLSTSSLSTSTSSPCC